MTKREIAELLRFISGLDHFQATDPIAVEAWAKMPAIAQGDHAAAEQAVIAHFSAGAKTIAVGDLIAALEVSRRQSATAIADDVRSARARLMIAKDWPETKPVPAEIRDRLVALRAPENEVVKANRPDDSPVLHWDTEQPYGEVGKVIR